MASLIKFNIDLSFTEDKEIVTGLYGNIGIILKEIEVTDYKNHKKIYKAFFKGKNVWLKENDFSYLDLSS